MDIAVYIPITTKRLLLDLFKPDDWKDYYQIELSEEQHKYNSESYSPRSEKDIQFMINDWSKLDFSTSNFAIILAIREKEQPSLIGWIGFKKIEGVDFKKGEFKEKGVAEVFYSIGKAHWNRGYCTEALKAMIQFGFAQLRLHRIWAGCDFENTASKRVMEKAGMTYESHWQKDRLRNGQWHDGLGYAIVNEEL
jgi:RimJ/RimL family protein N-acetyltransferase